MDKRLTIIIAALAVILLGVLGVKLLSPEDSWECVNGSWVKHGSPKSSQPSISCGRTEDKSASSTAQSASDTSTATSTPSTSGAAAAATSTPPKPAANIVVTSPKRNMEIGDPLVVTGKARVFENQFSIRVTENGKLVAETHAYANAPDAGQYGDFYEELSMPAALDETWLLVEVYSVSPKDGSEINMVRVMVYLKKTMEVKAYFAKREELLTTCDYVQPLVRKIPKTVAVGRESLLALLRGTSSDELKQGYYSKINPATALNNLIIKDGVAYADFNDSLNQVLDRNRTCGVITVTSEISKTLMQFPTIKSVVITVNGQTEGVLQP